MVFLYTLKDNLNVKGQATTIGFVRFSFNPVEFEKIRVLCLCYRNMGACSSFKTNLPCSNDDARLNQPHIWRDG